VAPGRIQFGSSHPDFFLEPTRGSGHGNPCSTSCMYTYTCKQMNSIYLFSISKAVDYEDLRSLKVPPKAMRLEKIIRNAP